MKAYEFEYVKAERFVIRNDWNMELVEVEKMNGVHVVTRVITPWLDVIEIERITKILKEKNKQLENQKNEEINEEIKND